MNNHQTIHPRTTPLRGTYTLPGDKSISHRALFFTTFRPGIPIHNLATGDDVRRTRDLIEAAGYRVHDRGEVVVVGERDARPDALEHPVRIECGNSGTTARLGLGWLTGEQGLWKVTGDESLRRRPMGRILRPLESLGATLRGGTDRLPVSVIAGEPLSGGGEFEVTSAQVHAGLVLAGLRSRQGIRIRRAELMRDHTLRTARYLRLPVSTEGDFDRVEPVGPDRVAPKGDHGDSAEADIPTAIHVPGDFSSAAFLVTAALLLPDAEIAIRDVGLNPTRIGFLHAVRELGGDVSWVTDNDMFEPIGTIHVRSRGRLRGRDFLSDAFDLPGMADELPLLVLLAAHAEGGSRITGAGELRVKESDRISSTVSILNRLGLDVQERVDGFDIAGGGRMQGGVEIDPVGDHRLAMLGGVAGLVTDSPVTIASPEIADVSWPDFWEILRK